MRSRGVDALRRCAGYLAWYVMLPRPSPSDRTMKLSAFRVCTVSQALLVLLLAQPSLAQQQTAPAAQSPAVSQPAAQAPAAPVAPSAVTAPSAPASPEAAAPARSLKTEAASLRELSPWSMFLNAAILVKAVMIGLAFASLVTWTIFIAKMIELAVARRKLKASLNKIADSR